MLSYQHIYHAGNFADVHKHSVLIAALQSLLKSKTPLTVMDTHAGRGLYDLDSKEALKTNEYEHGVGAVMRTRALSDYTAAIGKYMTKSIYPGTAKITQDMLRPGDTLTCFEKHPGEFEHLQKAMGQARVLKDDGFTALKNISPVKNTQGLVIIDPSYEIKGEYEALPKMLRTGWDKWQEACYFIWYPIMEMGNDAKLLDGLMESGITDILISEVHLDELPCEHYRLIGSGLALVNPPFDDETLGALTQEIANALPLKAQAMCGWL